MTCFAVSLIRISLENELQTVLTSVVIIIIPGVIPFINIYIYKLIVMKLSELSPGHCHIIFCPWLGHPDLLSLERRFFSNTGSGRQITGQDSN